MKPTISLVMLVLNESEFLEASLRSAIEDVDQCLVIDQGSTDGSVEIARRVGADILFCGPDNFLTKGEKYFRDMAINACKSDWLMLIDADEILSDGWHAIASGFIEFMEPLMFSMGMVMIDYWQMVGSSGFHTADSPLPNERPLLVRKHDGLKASESCNGTRCHSSYRPTINPTGIGRLPSGAELFHMGYAKTNLSSKMARNVERGDYSQGEFANSVLMKRAQGDPLSLLPDCIPSRIPTSRLPESIRQPKFKCEYNPETKRITGRTAI